MMNFMEFMKNHNYLNCGKECEDCAFADEDLMEQAERTIAMVRNERLLRTIRKDHPGERIAMIIEPDYDGDLVTESECMDIFDGNYDELEIDFLFDDQLILRYDEDEVVELDGVRYLLGAAEVLDIDESGYECSIGMSGIENAIDYMSMNTTEIAVDGKIIPALRLI